MTGATDDAAAARALLVDSFGRIRTQVSALTDELDARAAAWRPDPDANSVAWLLWHLTRVQDDHLADLAGNRQAWTEQGWRAHFDLPYGELDTGFGHSSAQVGRIHADARQLDGYHADVHSATMRYVEKLTAAELARIVDRSWDPPVTVAVRLVSVIGDCTAHLGQAQYVLGMYRRS